MCALLRTMNLPGKSAATSCQQKTPIETQHCETMEQSIARLTSNAIGQKLNENTICEKFSYHWGLLLVNCLFKKKTFHCKLLVALYIVAPLN